MADQTLPLNVSYEMKADDERQNCVGMESDEELCSSSSDSAEELYSSSTTDACRDGSQIIPQKDTPKIEVTMEPDEESNYTPEEKATYS